MGGGSQVTAPAIERRRHPRKPLAGAALIIPLLDDRKPAVERMRRGETLDASDQGLAITCEPFGDADSVMIGLPAGAGRTLYTGAMPRWTRPGPDGRTLMGVEFGGPGAELLLPANLVPVFRPQSLDFGHRLPQDLLSAWAELGVISPELTDRIQVCPHCRGLPTFRPGCPNCGSSRVEVDRLAHHYACAHVGPLVEFETAEGMVCPKCRLKHLVVGTDFEHLSGPVRCADCGWSGTAPESVGECLRCRKRFPGGDSLVRDLIGYIPNRFDPHRLASDREPAQLLWPSANVDGAQNLPSLLTFRFLKLPQLRGR